MSRREHRSLFGRLIYAVGPKEAARLLGLSLGHTYAITRDPMDPEHPDNTGTPGDYWTKVRTLLEVASSHPDERPLLLEWKLEFDVLMERLLDGGDPHAGLPSVPEACGAAAKEWGEAVSAALASRDRQHALAEVLEARAKLDALARSLRAALDTDGEG